MRIKTLPAGRKAVNIAIASLRDRGTRRRPAQTVEGPAACGFRGNPTQITLTVKAVQTLHYWARDPFGANETATGS